MSSGLLFRSDGGVSFLLHRMKDTFMTLLSEVLPAVVTGVMDVSGYHPWSTQGFA